MRPLYIGFVVFFYVYYEIACVSELYFCRFTMKKQGPVCGMHKHCGNNMLFNPSMSCSPQTYVFCHVLQVIMEQVWERQCWWHPTGPIQNLDTRHRAWGKVIFPCRQGYFVPFFKTNRISGESMLYVHLPALYIFICHLFTIFSINPWNFGRPLAQLGKASPAVITNDGNILIVPPVVS